MIGSVWSFGNSNVVNTISNALAVPTLVGVAGGVWHVWHSRCGVRACVRPGQVPEPDGTKMYCCKHASRRGVTHSDS